MKSFDMGTVPHGQLDMQLGGSQNSQELVEIKRQLAQLQSSSKSSSGSTGLKIVTAVSLLLAIVALGLAGKVLNEPSGMAVADMTAVISTSPKIGNLKGFTAGLPLFEGEGEWTEKVSLPDATSDLQAVECNGKIYIMGGLVGTPDTVSAKVWEYDPFYEFTTAKAAMPEARYRFGIAGYDKKVYTAGGFTDKTTGDSGHPVNRVDIYDTVSNSWTTGVPMSNKRGDLAMAEFGGKIYAFAGYGKEYNDPVSGTLVEEYDIAANKWTTKTPMNHNRGDVVAAELDGLIYVVGGWEFPDNGAPFASNKVEIYNPAKDEWTQGPNLNNGRGDSAISVMRGKLFIAAGETSSTDVPCAPDGSSLTSCWICGGCIPTHDVEMYDPKANMWTTMAPYPGTRYRFAGATANNVLYTFGGHTQGENKVNNVAAFHYAGHRTDLYLHVKEE